MDNEDNAMTDTPYGVDGCLCRQQEYPNPDTGWHSSDHRYRWHDNALCPYHGIEPA